MGFDRDGNEVGDNRPSRYVEQIDGGGERVIYRASSLGRCTRAVLAEANGSWPAEPVPDWMREAWDEGTAAEAVISKMWDELTEVPTVDDQLEVELLVGEVHGREVYVRGHIDGRALDVGGPHSDTVPYVLREYKKFRESTWLDFLRKSVEVNANYPWQVAVYMHALGVDACEFVGGRCTGVDSEGVPIIEEVVVRYIQGPPIPLAAICKRVLTWERMIDAGMEGGDVTCDVAMYPCPFFKFHDEPDVPDTFELPVTPEVRAVLDTWVDVERRYQQAMAPVRVLEKQRKAAGKALRDLIDAAGGSDAKAITGHADGGAVAITRKRAHYPEAKRAAYDTDSISLNDKDTI